MDGLTAAEIAEERFAWIDDLEEDYISPTVAVLAGVARDQAIRRRHGDPQASRLLTVRQAADEMARDDRDQDLIGVGTVGDLVFAVEAGGHTTAIPGALRALSQGGRCFSVQIDIDGGDRVHYAVDGEVVVYEEHCGPVHLPSPSPRSGPRGPRVMGPGALSPASPHRALPSGRRRDAMEYGQPRNRLRAGRERPAEFDTQQEARRTLLASDQTPGDLMYRFTRHAGTALAGVVLLAGMTTACSGSAATSKSSQAQKATSSTAAPTAQAASRPAERRLDEEARDLLTGTDPLDGNDEDFVSSGSLAIPGQDMDTTIRPGTALHVEVACAGEGTVTFTAVSGNAKKAKRVDCAQSTRDEFDFTTAGPSFTIQADSPAAEKVGTAYVVRHTT
jgi:hypothetical protein